jgi:hypothetical protein
MAKIIRFPEARSLDAAVISPSIAPRVPRQDPAAGRPHSFRARTGNGPHAVAWVLVAITSPLWMRIAALDLIYQGCRALYHWQTPGMHPGWTLFLHALGAAFLGIFFLREPKDLR